MSHREQTNRMRPAHRQPGKVRWCSFLWVAGFLVLVVSLIMVIGGFALKNLPVVKAGGAGLILFLVLSFIAFFWSLGLNCSVCANPVLTVRSREKHTNAKRFPLAGYRLGIAFPALFRGKYHCMYCGEKITLSVRPVKPIYPTSASLRPRSDKPICSMGHLPEPRKKPFR